MNVKDYRLYKGAWVCIDELHSNKLSRMECKKLLSHGGLFVRNVYDFDTPTPTSFWYVIKDSFGGLEELTSGARRDVRKSLRTYNVRRITVDELRTVGYPIFASAQESYKVKCEVVSQEAFDAMIDTYEKKGERMEYWGVEKIESGEIVAVAVNTLKESSCEYSTLKCKPEALKDGTQPYYGLIYEMNRHYLTERGMKYVNDGARSITNHSNIQPFLISKFKFRKAYCQLSIHYKWWLGVIVKILYPFRKLIPIKKVSQMLDMEAMCRGKI